MALCELYALNTIAWMFWVDKVNVQLIERYSRQLLRGVLHLNSVNYYLLFAAVAVAILTPVFVIRRAAPALFGSVCRAVDPGGSAIFGTRRIALRGVVSLLLYGCLFALLFGAARDVRAFRGEPVINLFSALPSKAQLPRTFYDDAARPASEDTPYSVSIDPGRKNVVVIVVDALRADHLARYGYARATTPFLSRMLENTPVLESKWSTSACSISECGILAMLTSRPFARLNAGLLSLPEALRRAGYGTYFAVSGDFTRAFRGLQTLVANHARIFADGLSDDRYLSGDDRTVLRTLNQIPHSGDTPAFFYLHLLSVHRLGKRYQPPTWTPVSLMDFRTPGAQPGFRINIYDNGIRQADTVIEQILLTLKQKGYLDRAVVVVTADHGQAMGEHGKWGHGLELYAESIDIPLFFFDTDFRASRTVPYATQLDIAPTIAELVGIPIPAQWEGRSLTGTLPEISTAQTTIRRPIEAVIWRTADASWKYLFDTADGTEQLFELRRDPGERINLIPKAEPGLLSFLRETRIRKFNDRDTAAQDNR